MSHVYDAVIVLCGNMVKQTDGQFAPTTYEDADMFGMLGGAMRITAAVDLYKAKQASTFVFSTGISQKTVQKYGADIPTEASVYANTFRERLGAQQPPTIILEDKSTNSTGNITECLGIIKQHGWHKVAVVTSNYHVPRVQMLCDLVRQKIPVTCDIIFLGAEDIVQQYEPGVYDQQIADAMASPAGQLRLKNETQGLADFKNGTYVLGEFQLNHPS